MPKNFVIIDWTAENFSIMLAYFEHKSKSIEHYGGIVKKISGNM